MNVTVTLLQKHVEHCSRCRSRLERERRLRSIPRVDEAAPDDASLVYTFTASPLGTLWIAAGQNGVIAIAYATDEAAFCDRLEEMRGDAPWFDPAGLPHVKDSLAGYFRGERREFDLSVDLGASSPFRQAVIEAVMGIPYGETRTYGEVAEEAGAPRAARAVGSVMAGCDIAVLVPCHRVVRADGMPASYGSDTLGSCGITYKEALLTMERRARGKPLYVL